MKTKKTDTAKYAGTMSEQEAREIAIATGIPTLCSKGIYIVPMSKEEELKLGEEQSAVCGLYRALEVIANTKLDPVDFRTRLGPKHYCIDLPEFAERCAIWINRLAAAGEPAGQDVKSNKE